MNKSEYIKESVKRWTEENFRNHEASVLVSLSDGNPVKSSVLIIQWKKPGTWSYAMRFIIHSQWLCVLGDCGEAIYQWGDGLTVEFLEKIDFDYMMGKCRATHPSGRRGWDERVWASGLRKEIAEMNCNNTASDSVVQVLKEHLRHKSPKDEYEASIHEMWNDGRIDSDMASDLKGLGEVPDFMSIGHHVGLQMAIKQLKAMPPI